MVIYITKNGGLERLTDNMRFVPNLNINAENLHFFLMFLELYMRMQNRSYVRMSRASLALFFQNIYLLIKIYMFHFNIS